MNEIKLKKGCKKQTAVSLTEPSSSTISCMDFTSDLLMTASKICRSEQVDSAVHCHECFLKLNNE